MLLLEPHAHFFGKSRELKPDRPAVPTYVTDSAHCQLRNEGREYDRVFVLDALRVMFTREREDRNRSKLAAFSI